MTMSSRRGRGCGHELMRGEFPSVAQQRPQHIDEAAGERLGADEYFRGHGTVNQGVSTRPAA
jgi:hypothetical protein